jgi:BlaI family transcriptional regulator, penicillinase repressor
LISKADYTKTFMKSFMGSYFGNSFREMVSFFAKEDNMSVREIETLMEDVKKELENEK